MGYSNLFSHVLKQHPDYVTTLANSGFNSGTLVVFIDQKSQTVYCWLDFVTERSRLASVRLSLSNSVSWSFHSDHYVAVFAVFEHDQRSEKVILALAPIADDGVEDQTAESHVAFLAGIQPFFKRDISSIIYLVGDNCSVNTRQKTNLRPVLRQATRWGSTFQMLERYIDLRDALDMDDDDIVSLMPTRRQDNRVRALRDQLRDFQSATMKLQEDSTTLLDVRDIFVALVEKHPVVDKYLAADAAIVKDPDFEAACVLALADKTEELTEDQQLMLSPFETVAAATATPSPGGRPQGGPVGEVEPAHGAEEVWRGTPHPSNF
ncbi:hypothetical protein PF010_g17523 [Phytophthora fragariae]|uniref:Uncharacterized protein n=1 Tax=Phytophthora fragariae TaxID=53985 RepID=A0A6A3XY97_9STRA|nr:hypothetical protein PF010_g17523 [Phytophthora fragariae]KAE9210380.1 hypothetical protein PF002_g18838 [Phytophthora fragariae]